MNIGELKDFAADYLKNLKPEKQAVVVGLRGDLGAGKTTFTQACADLLDVSDAVTSPTFVILKKYRIGTGSINKNFDYLIHIDAYRLKNGKELESIGWQSIISDPKNLIMIEWPELVKEVMLDSAKYIDFKHVDETTREIKHER